MVTEVVLESNAAVPPGELLQEELEARGMTQRELAHLMGRPSQAISEICWGKKVVTAETALELERVLGTPAYIWLSLEMKYRLALARQRQGQATRSILTPSRRVAVPLAAKSGRPVVAVRPGGYRLRSSRPRSSPLGPRSR